MYTLFFFNTNIKYDIKFDIPLSKKMYLNGGNIIPWATSVVVISDTV